MLTETVNRLTNHTPRDLAGWDVCLDAIDALLAGVTLDPPRKARWEERYRMFKERLAGIDD